MAKTSKPITAGYTSRLRRNFMQGEFTGGFDALAVKVAALIDVEVAARELLRANPQLHQHEAGKALAAALVKFEKA